MAFGSLEKALLAFFKISRIFREISPRKIRDWKQVAAPLEKFRRVTHFVAVFFVGNNALNNSV